MSSKSSNSSKNSSPRAMPVETIITRFKSAQQKRQLREMDRSMSKITELLKNPVKRKPRNPKSQTKTTQHQPHKPTSPPQTSVNINKEEVQSLDDVEAVQEYYPSKLKRQIVLNKVQLKPKHELTVIAHTNKRKRSIPQKGFQEDYHPRLSPPESRDSSPGAKRPKRHSQDVTMMDMAEMIQLIEESGSMDDEDLLEILTCPSPVWWEDPPDGYHEGALFSRPRSSAEMYPSIRSQLHEDLIQRKRSNTPNVLSRNKRVNVKRSSETVKKKEREKPEVKETNSDIALGISLTKCNDRFIEKRSNLESVLGNLKSKSVNSDVKSVEDKSVVISSSTSSSRSSSSSDSVSNKVSVIKNLCPKQGDRVTKADGSVNNDLTNLELDTVKIAKRLETDADITDDEHLTDISFQDDDYLNVFENMNIPVQETVEISSEELPVAEHCELSTEVCDNDIADVNFENDMSVFLELPTATPNNTSDVCSNVDDLISYSVPEVSNNAVIGEHDNIIFLETKTVNEIPTQTMNTDLQGSNDALINSGVVDEAAEVFAEVRIDKTADTSQNNSPVLEIQNVNLKIASNPRRSSINYVVAEGCTKVNNNTADDTFEHKASILKMQLINPNNSSAYRRSSDCSIKEYVAGSYNNNTADVSFDSNYVEIQAVNSIYRQDCCRTTSDYSTNTQVAQCCISASTTDVTCYATSNVIQQPVVNSYDYMDNSKRTPEPIGNYEATKFMKYGQTMDPTFSDKKTSIIEAFLEMELVEEDTVHKSHKGQKTYLKNRQQFLDPSSTNQPVDKPKSNSESSSVIKFRNSDRNSINVLKIEVPRNPPPLKTSDKRTNHEGCVPVNLPPLRRNPGVIRPNYESSKSKTTTISFDTLESLNSIAMQDNLDSISDTNICFMNDEDTNFNHYSDLEITSVRSGTCMQTKDTHENQNIRSNNNVYSQALNFAANNYVHGPQHIFPGNNSYTTNDLNYVQNNEVYRNNSNEIEFQSLTITKLSDSYTHTYKEPEDPQSVVVNQHDSCIINCNKIGQCAKQQFLAANNLVSIQPKMNMHPGFTKLVTNKTPIQETNKHITLLKIVPDESITDRIPKNNFCNDTKTEMKAKYLESAVDLKALYYEKKSDDSTGKTANNKDNMLYYFKKCKNLHWKHKHSDKCSGQGLIKNNKNGITKSKKKYSQDGRFALGNTDINLNRTSNSITTNSVDIKKIISPQTSKNAPKVQHRVKPMDGKKDNVKSRNSKRDNYNKKVQLNSSNKKNAHRKQETFQSKDLISEMCINNAKLYNKRKHITSSSNGARKKGTLSSKDIKEVLAINSNKLIIANKVTNTSSSYTEKVTSPQKDKTCKKESHEERSSISSKKGFRSHHDKERNSKIDNEVNANGKISSNIDNKVDTVNVAFDFTTVSRKFHSNVVTESRTEINRNGTTEINNKASNGINKKATCEYNYKPINDLPTNEINIKATSEIEKKAINDIHNKGTIDIHNIVRTETNTETINEINDKPTNEINGRAANEINNKVETEINNKYANEIVNKSSSQFSGKATADFNNTANTQMREKATNISNDETITEVAAEFSTNKAPTEIIRKFATEVNSSPTAANNNVMTTNKIEKKCIIASNTKQIRYCMKCSSIFDTVKCNYCYGKKGTEQKSRCPPDDYILKLEQGFICDVCRYKALSKDSLERHMLSKCCGEKR